METIFDFKPTSKELEEFDVDYTVDSLDTYKKDLEERAKASNSSIEYEATCDIQQLASNRNDQPMLEKYTKIIEEKFKNISNRIFNE